MRMTIRLTALVLLVCVFAPTPAPAIDMDKLHREAFEQWTRWIVSRDEEKRRSAAASLGSFGEQAQTVGLLADALADRDIGVRRNAATSLWKLGDARFDISAAASALRARLDDPSAAVRVQAAGALQRTGVDPRDLIEVRRSVLADGDWFDVALAARDLIGLVDGADLVEPLLGSLRESPRTRSDDRFDAGDVLEPLVLRGGTAVAPALLRALDDPDLPKAPLLDALGRLEAPPEGWRDALLRAAGDGDPDVRERAVERFAELVERGSAGSGWIDPMLPLLEDRDEDVRSATCVLFGTAGGAAHSAVDPLLDLLAREEDESVRRSAIRALAAIGDASESFDRAIKADIAARTRAPLQAIAAEAAGDNETREAAGQALRTIGSGSATHTKVLTTTTRGDDAAMQRLRARSIEFTEDAFWRALGERDVATVEDLLAAGLSPNTISADGMPPLHLVVMAGCDHGQPTAEATRRIVAALIAHGADPNQRDRAGGNPVLHRASSCDAALVRQLIAAKADVRAKNAMQLSAFTLFVIGSPAAAEALLDAGYRPDARERTTVKAMHDAERDPARRKVLARALAAGGR